MFRWAELALQPSQTHLPFLGDFMRQSGRENELLLVATSEQTWADDLVKVKAQVGQIRLGRDLAERVTEHHLSQGYLEQKLGWAECLTRLGGHWWPQSFVDRAILLELSQLNTNIDFRKMALIIGANGLGAMALAALVRYGYRNIRVVDADPNKAQDFSTKYRGVFFDININHEEIDRISRIYADSTLVVNCLGHGQDDGLIKDLCYFNYLDEHGLVIETNLFPVESPLVREARKLGVRVIPGYLVWGRVDSLWVEHLFGAPLPLKRYQQGLHLACVGATSA